MRKYQLTFLTTLSLMLGACVTHNPQLIGPFPENYKQIIRANIEKTFFDPYSMRNVGISEPKQGYLFFDQGWIVCIQANAKNRMGGYTGLEKTAFVIRNGSVITSQSRSDVCNLMEIKPWPEMEGK